MARRKYFIVGIDEAGRGPLAGPLAVAAVVASIRLSAQKIKFRRISKIYFLRGIKDSKKLSVRQRDEWRKKIKSQSANWRTNLKSACVLINNKTIDRIGINKATCLAVSKVLRKLAISRPRGSCMRVLLDGGMTAPKKYEQKTIIKGDEKIPLIAAASIIAKTTRDAKMLRLHKKFPQYRFNFHKGYGTKLHYKMLKRYGLSLLHRRSFCQKILSKN